MAGRACGVHPPVTRNTDRVSTLLVRPAHPQDLAALVTLYQQLSTRNPASVSPRHEEAWQAMLAHPGLHVLVAEQDGQLVGTLTLALLPNLTRGVRPYGVIENVVTAGTYRNRGIGRALLEEAERLAREARAYKVMLMSGAEVHGAHAFYQKCGYQADTKQAFEKRWP